MKLEEQDVREMVRLVGEVAALSGTHLDKKRFLMDGLCRLVGADAWVWGLSCQRDPDKPQVYVSMARGGFTEETFVKFLEAVEHPAMIELAAPFFEELRRDPSHLTRSRHQISDAKSLANSPAMPAWQAADIGPVILSMRPLDARSGSTIGLYRRHGRPEFTLRESRIAHIVLTEVPWLHEQGWPEDRGARAPGLSRRQRLALNLLILGHNRKEIAARMGISANTVQGYVKEIYSHFSVHSQGELMRRFYEGNGRDGV